MPITCGMPCPRRPAHSARQALVADEFEGGMRSYRTLYVVGHDWGGPDAVGGATGQLVSFAAPASGAGYP